MNPPNNIERVTQWATQSIGLKLLMMGFLTVMLLIPAQMISSTIRERQQTQASAVQEISSKWGNAQTIGGPVLVVPYVAYGKDAKGQRYSMPHFAYFLPDELRIEGDVNTEIRYRGIYEAVLYGTPLKITGRFKALDFSAWRIPAENVNWQEATVIFGISDMRGIRSNLTLHWNGQEKAINPGVLAGSAVLPSGVSASVRVTPGASHTFSIETQIQGSQTLHFLPFGRSTTVQLKSRWASPSFTGAFLPTERNITPQGFSATWHVLHLNRNYPQSWSDHLTSEVASSSFGVDLVVPADQYQKSSRSTKYAILFILLTFGALFFIELKQGKPVHVLQYLLVGLAIVFFYSLLLSLAEHMGFNAAYAVSSDAIVLMVTLYAKGIFGLPRVTALVAGLMSALYVYLFSILQMEDYALLIGNVGLFAALSAAMYLSRKADWYKNSKG